MRYDIKTFFKKTFGGLSGAYYLRNFVFGFVFTIFSISIMFWKGGVNFFGVFIIVVNTILYPYARFVYEKVVRFILGGAQVVDNPVLFILFRLAAKIVCWMAALLIAPISLIYLYFQHSRKENKA